MIKVIIADDHAILRRGLVHTISETIDMQVTDEACNGDELIEKVRAGKFDVVVMDLSMPGRGGFDVLQQLRAEYSSLPILVLSMHAEDQYAVRLLRAGAAGYLNKESPPSELIRAIRRVAEGGKYMTPMVAEALLQRLDSNSSGPLHEQLSDREFQVMRMLASGNSVSEISDMLALSVKTISTYRTRVLEKMSMKSNAELARYALENRLLL